MIEMRCNRFANMRSQYRPPYQDSGGCNGEESKGEEEDNEGEEGDEKGKEVGRRRPTLKIDDRCHFSKLRRRALWRFGGVVRRKHGTHPPYNRQMERHRGPQRKGLLARSVRHTPGRSGAPPAIRCRLGHMKTDKRWTSAAIVFRAIERA
jgi:hypothetical protein